MSTAKTPVYVLTHLGQPVRVGSYKAALVSNSPSVYYDITKARAAASKGWWIHGHPSKVQLSVKPMFLIEG